jgi:hypothetical protein
MNTINMPGFTAEAALHKSRQAYYMTYFPDFLVSQTVSQSSTSKAGAGTRQSR